MLVERVGDLQPTDECSNGYVFITTIYQSYLALEIVNVVLLAFPCFYPNREEMVAILLELSLRTELIVENVNYIIETLKRVLQG